MVILAVGCHPDDLEIGCGGTLAKCAKRGDKVVLVNVASGNVGHKIYTKEEIATIRLEEAKNSASVIGAQYHCLNLDDMFVRRDYDKGVRLVSDIIRQTKPDVIITHGKDEYMVDHSITSTIVFDAAMAATVTHFPSEYPVFNKFTPIYFMENTLLVNSFPDEFVDISDTIEIKLEMLLKHKSQIGWLKDHDNYDVLEMVKNFSRTRGFQCNTGFAEGFTLCKQAHHLPTKRFLP